MVNLQVHKGVRFLRSYLKHAPDFHKFDFPQFQQWVKSQVKFKQRDQSFLQRCKIRDIKKLHWQQFCELQELLKKCHEAWEACPLKQQIEDLESKILGNEKAIEGLKKAVQARSGNKKQASLDKLADFEQKREEALALQQQILLQAPEKIALEKAQQEWQLFCDTVEITSNEKILEGLLKQQGNRSSSAGSNFESVSGSIVEKSIIPELRRRYRRNHDVTPQLKILSQVKLGCARAEIDYVVVALQPQIVEVLAMIEVKRNINDVASGFSMRQENISWFLGDTTGYDPQIYRTKVFREGHFDCSVDHEEHGEKYTFSPQSFALFHKEDQYFMDRLYFISSNRNRIAGMNASEHSRIIYRMATDVFFDENNEDYLKKFYEWCKEIVSPWQTKNVIELYAKHRNWGQQFFVVEK